MQTESFAPVRPGRLSRGAVGLAGVVLLTAAGLCYGLEDRGLWYEEACSWRLAQFPLPEIFSRTAEHNYSPFYYVVLKAWVLAWGDSVFSLRLLSVLLLESLAVSLYALIGVGLRGAGGTSSVPGQRQARQVGLLAAVLLLLSPFEWRFGQEVQMYALGALLLVLGSAAFFKALFSTGRGALLWWGCYAALRVAALYTHYWAVFAVLAEWLCAGLFLYRRAAWAAGPGARSAWAGFLFAALAVVAAYGPWLPSFLGHWERSYERFSAVQISEVLLFPWSTFFMDQTTRTDYGKAALSAAFLVVLGLLLCRKASPLRVYLWAMAVLPTALAFAAYLLADRRGVLLDRFYFVSFPYLIAGVAVLVGAVPVAAVRAALAFFLVLVTFTALTLFWYDFNVPPSPGCQAVARDLLSRYRPEDRVLIGSSFLYFPMKYYLRDKVRLELLVGQGEAVFGQVALKEDDFAPPEGQGRGRPHRVWVIESPILGGTAAPVQGTWQVHSLESYRQLAWAKANGEMVPGTVMLLEYGDSRE